MIEINGNPELNNADLKARIQAAKQEYDTPFETECVWHSRNAVCDQCKEQH